MRPQANLASALLIVLLAIGASSARAEENGAGNPPPAAAPLKLPERMMKLFPCATEEEQRQIRDLLAQIAVNKARAKYLDDEIKSAQEAFDNRDTENTEATARLYKTLTDTKERDLAPRGEANEKVEELRDQVTDIFTQIEARPCNPPEAAPPPKEVRRLPVPPVVLVMPTLPPCLDDEKARSQLDDYLYDLFLGQITALEYATTEDAREEARARMETLADLRRAVWRIPYCPPKPVGHHAVAPNPPIPPEHASRPRDDDDDGLGGVLGHVTIGVGVGGGGHDHHGNGGSHEHHDAPPPKTDEPPPHD